MEGLVQFMICPKCKYNMPDTANFCPKCQTPVSFPAQQPNDLLHTKSKRIIRILIILILCLLLCIGAALAWYFFKPHKAAIPEDASVNPENGHAYYVYTDSITWTEARKSCEAVGGHLITISDEEEERYAEQLAKQCTEKENFWLGGYYNRSSGSWEWVDGTPFDYTNWDCWVNANGEKLRQPDNSTGDEYYIRFANRDKQYDTWIEYRGGWNDIANYAGSSENDVPLNSFGYICEWD